MSESTINVTENHSFLNVLHDEGTLVTTSESSVLIISDEENASDSMLVIDPTDVDIIIDETYQSSVVEVPEVTILHELQQGVSGADGADGLDSDKTYVHHEMSATSVWYITHNLGKHPSVTVVDSADTLVYGEVAYTDANNLTVTFTSPFAGRAYLN